MTNETGAIRNEDRTLRDGARVTLSLVQPVPVEESELDDRALRTAAQFSRPVVSQRLLTGFYRLFEFVVAIVVGLAIYVGYVGHSAAFLPLYLFVSTLAAGSLVSIVQLLGGYRIEHLRTLLRQMSVLSVGLLGALSVLALVLFFLRLQDVYSRVWLVSWLLACGLALFASRAVLAARLAHWARNGVMERRAVLVGGGPAAESLIRTLEAQKGNDIRICGIFDDRDDSRSPTLVAGYPKLGTVRQLVQFARLARIDILIVTLPLSAEKRIQALLADLWVLPIDVRLSAQSSNLRFRPRSYSYVGDVPFIDVVDRPLADWDRIAKRAFDLVFAALALVLLWPLMVLTALAIRLDSPGPVFFRQKRHGFNNEIIEVTKFRSLRHEAGDPLARTIVTRNDPRVTRVGRLIRRSSIDELPQLFDVLKGRLSLVGPRPHAVYARSSMNQAFVEIVDGYFGRHRVKPGITGWAQVKGWRGEIDQPVKLRARFEHDLYYIENWSLLFDVYILLATPLSLLRTKSAY